MRTVALVTTVALAMTSLWLVVDDPAWAQDGGGPTLTPADETSWREVLEEAVAAATTTSYEASMVVIVLDAQGPGVTEVQLRKGRDGDLAISAAESWLIARGDGAMLFKEDAEQLLHVGQVHALPFAMAEVERNYDVDVAGRAELSTGPAVAIAFRRGGALSERLFVDDETGLVVRRETYDQGGQPVRVTVLQQLRVTNTAMEPLAGGGEDALGSRIQLAPEDVSRIEGHDWPVPTAVGDGFDLRVAFAIDRAAAVQLVYSDGLYTVSLLEQPGSVDAEALAGAVREVHEGIPVYRWPAMEPLRMVWNGDGHTFTAVTDAPAGVLLDVVRDLPHDTEPSMPSRVGRGLVRLGHWLWPFS